MKDDRKRRKRVLLYPNELPAPVINNQRDDTRRSSPEGLSRIEIEFCLKWRAYGERARAAIEAGYSPSGADQKARMLLRDPRIQRYLAIMDADSLRRQRFDGDEFLAREVLLATTPMSELQEVWIPPCRFCWGRNNEYQRTYAEFSEDLEKWMRQPEKRRRGLALNLELSVGNVLVYDDSDKKLPFDQRGGDGYDPEQPPNPACPNCHGRGNEHPERGSIPYIRLRDTRELSAAGKMLFAGIKNTGRGLEMLVHSQEAARGRLMGMLGKFLELRAGAQQASTAGVLEMGVNSAIAGLLSYDPKNLSDEELDALLAANGVVIDVATGEGTEGAAGASDSGEAPPTRGTA